MTKPKFKVGDRVNIVPAPTVTPSAFTGLSGTVDEVYTEDELRYYVKLDGRSTYVFWEEQLETAVLDELAKVIT
jgi:transcription antitermination factor NusG